jgi:hypothetical protein
LLLSINSHPLIKNVIQGRIEIGGVNESDFIDELFRQLEKKEKYDAEKSQLLLGHPDIHRVIKEVVKFEAELKDSNLDFTKKLVALMLRHANECIDSRAVWIFVTMLENERTKDLVAPTLKKSHKKEAEQLLAKDSKATGVKVLLKHLA